MDLAIDSQSGKPPSRGGALRGGVFLRFFLAAREEQTAAAACPEQLRQPCFSRQLLPTSTTASQKDSSGRPSMRSELSSATISDSVEEWETTVCFLHTAFRGKNVLGPTKAAKMPVVLLEELTQSAKEASVKSIIDNLSAESPIQP